MIVGYLQLYTYQQNITCVMKQNKVKEGFLKGNKLRLIKENYDIKCKKSSDINQHLPYTYEICNKM